MRVVYREGQSKPSIAQSIVSSYWQDAANAADEANHYDDAIGTATRTMNHVTWPQPPAELPVHRLDLQVIENTLPVQSEGR